MMRRKVLLTGWDAADWKVVGPLLAAGKMPNVQRLVESGARGQIATLHPPLSPMLWTSIATGKRPFKHGVLGFAEPTPDGRGVQPVTNLSRKTKALWNILQQNGLRSVVTGWWPSHPAEPINGVMVSDHYARAFAPLDQSWPLAAGTVHPPQLAETLAGLRVHPDSLSPEMVEPFIPLAQEIDQEEDKRLSGFLRTLAECMSIHAAALWLLEHQPWDFSRSTTKRSTISVTASCAIIRRGSPGLPSAISSCITMWSRWRTNSTIGCWVNCWTRRAPTRR